MCRLCAQVLCAFVQLHVLLGAQLCVLGLCLAMCAAQSSDVFHTELLIYEQPIRSNFNTREINTREVN